MQFSALLRHFGFPQPKTIHKDSPKSISASNPPTEALTSSVGRFYVMMGDKKCWEASGEQREKFKILACEIQEYKKLWARPSRSGAIPTWGLYMIGLTPNDAVPTLLVCCTDKCIRKEMRRLIESSGILAEEKYHHIRIGDCSKPPELCDKPRMLSSRQENQHRLAVNDVEDCVSVQWEWNNVPGKMTVTFEHASTESSSQFSTVGMTFRHLGRDFALTASHTLFEDLHSSLHEEEDSDFEFDLEGDHDSEYSYTRDQEVSAPDRQDVKDSDSEPDNATLIRRWQPKSSIFIYDHDLDYAITQKPASTSVNSDSNYHPSLQELIQRTSLKPEDTQVTAITTSNGRIEGSLSGTPSFIRLPHATRFQEVWTVHFDGQLALGDSGSLVVDANTGRIFGHIVAGGLSSGVAYIMPAFKVIEHIMLSLGPRETDAEEGERSYPRANFGPTISYNSPYVYRRERTIRPYTYSHDHYLEHDDSGPLATAPHIIFELNSPKIPIMSSRSSSP
jgi:hypothetical protein